MSGEYEEMNLLRPESLSGLIDEITPDIYASLKIAIELGKWNDGSNLNPEQLESCLQAIILYESRHLAESERTGFNFPAACSSKQGAANSDPLAVIDVSDGGRVKR